jgi:hypothetical protein
MMEIENEDHYRNFGAPLARRGLPQFAAGSARRLLPWQPIHLGPVHMSRWKIGFACTFI